MSIYFISGIDTNIGKSYAVGMIARSLRQQNISSITVKLVQTGNDGFSEDLELHRKLMGIAPLPEDKAGLTAPEIFTFPASPHLAAKLDQRPLDLKKIDRAIHEVATHYDVVLVEGAGGVAVPLTEDYLTIDWCADHHYPLILVTSGRLGSLNHTILSLEAAVRRGVRVAGCVYNWSPDADPVINEDSKRMILKYLKKFGQPEVLVELPRVGNVPPDFDASALFHSREA